MQRQSYNKLSTVIILLSIMTITLQFGVYYFISVPFIILGVSSLLSLLCCHILLGQSSSYDACFNYSMLNLFISSVIILLSYPGTHESYLPYSGSMLGIAIINWFVPSVYCFLNYMFDSGIKVDDYISFYWNDTILFGICYLGIILYSSFSTTFPWAYPYNPTTPNFILFHTIAAQIEDYLYGVIPIKDIVIYLSLRIVPLVPYGFYLTLILRSRSRLWRLVALLFVPFLLEILQFFIIPNRSDIDDIIYGIAGGLLGSLFYYLLNTIFRLFTGKEFLEKDPSSIYNRTLHF